MIGLAIVFIAVGFIVSGAAVGLFDSDAKTAEIEKLVDAAYPELAELHYRDAMDIIKHKDIDKYAELEIAIDKLYNAQGFPRGIALMLIGLGCMIVGGIVSHLER